MALGLSGGQKRNRILKQSNETLHMKEQNRPLLEQEPALIDTLGSALYTMALAPIVYHQSAALVNCAFFAPKGRKRYITLYSTKSSRDLENKRMEYLAAQKEGRNVVKSNLTLQEYAEQWLKTYKATREKNTYAMYKRIINNHMGDAGAFVL